MTSTMMLTPEIATLVRRVMRKRFPGTDIYVYTDGEHLRLHWDNRKAAASIVHPVAEQYIGWRYDPSVERVYRLSHWLCPDGSVRIAQTTGSGGDDPEHRAQDNKPPRKDARLVQFALRGVRSNNADLDRISAFPAMSRIADPASRREAAQRYLTNEKLIKECQEWIALNNIPGPHAAVMLRAFTDHDIDRYTTYEHESLVVRNRKRLARGWDIIIVAGQETAVQEIAAGLSMDSNSGCVVRPLIPLD